jgi:hypothetical protein
MTTTTYPPRTNLYDPRPRHKQQQPPLAPLSLPNSQSSDGVLTIVNKSIASSPPSIYSKQQHDEQYFSGLNSSTRQHTMRASSQYHHQQQQQTIANKKNPMACLQRQPSSFNKKKMPPTRKLGMEMPMDGDGILRISSKSSSSKENKTNSSLFDLVAAATPRRSEK